MPGISGSRELVSGQDLPAGDFHGRELPFTTEKAGLEIFRIHRKEHGPVWFGNSGDNRFDSPDGSFGVLYAGYSERAAFVETVLRNPRIRIVDRAFMDERVLISLKTTKPLKLATVYGPSLKKMGATAILTSGPLDVSQAWAAAIESHPKDCDGIKYRCNRDNNEFAVALFERAKDKIHNPGGVNLLDNPFVLGGLLDHYEMGID